MEEVEEEYELQLVEDVELVLLSSLEVMLIAEVELAIELPEDNVLESLVESDEMIEELPVLEGCSVDDDIADVELGTCEDAELVELVVTNFGRSRLITETPDVSMTAPFTATIKGTLHTSERRTCANLMLLCLMIY